MIFGFFSVTMEQSLFGFEFYKQYFFDRASMIALFSLSNCLLDLESYLVRCWRGIPPLTGVLFGTVAFLNSFCSLVCGVRKKTGPSSGKVLLVQGSILEVKFFLENY